MGKKGEEIEMVTGKKLGEYPLGRLLVWEKG
jgi:hypothetical protein